MLDFRNIDFLGKLIVVLNSSDISKIGLSGIVIYETKNILKIRDNKNLEKTIKKNEILEFKIIN